MPLNTSRCNVNRCIYAQSDSRQPGRTQGELVDSKSSNKCSHSRRSQRQVLPRPEFNYDSLITPCFLRAANLEVNGLVAISKAEIEVPVSAPLRMHSWKGEAWRNGNRWIITGAQVEPPNSHAKSSLIGKTNCKSLRFESLIRGSRE